MTKSGTKAVINQSFSAIYNFYWVSTEGTYHTNFIHETLSHIPSVGATEDKTENMEKRLRSNGETFETKVYFG